MELVGQEPQRKRYTRRRISKTAGQRSDRGWRGWLPAPADSRPLNFGGDMSGTTPVNRLDSYAWGKDPLWGAANQFCSRSAGIVVFGLCGR